MAINPEDQEGDRVKEQAQRLTANPLSLAFISDNQRYDKMSDAGCGLYDTYRSDPLLKPSTRSGTAAREMEKMLADAA
ncbi:MAG: hypothetical protein ACOC6K_04515 [Thermodesulfobacteriota bacterium]